MFLKTVFHRIRVSEKRKIIPSVVKLYSTLKSTNFKSHLHTKCTPAGITARNLHKLQTLCAKNYVEKENTHLYDHINASLFMSFPQKTESEVITNNEFKSLLNKNWRLSTATEILNAFKSVRKFAISNNISVSDPQFDKLVDGLMDHCEKLTDDQILELLYCLAEYPLCESFESHNFHDIWSCLDDICCWKMHAWDIDKILNFADAWYKLSLARICNFTWEVLDRHARKADEFNKNQLVKILFLFNVGRRRKVDFEYEYALQTKIREMNIDEMAVVALGFFKTQTKIQMDSILEAMMNEVIKTSKNIHEMSLTAILKILRFSKPIKLPHKMREMLDKLTPEIERISDLACLHLALAPTGLLMLHEKSLGKCAEKILRSITDTNQIRIKEIERILNALTMFNYDPKINPDIFKSAFTEIHREERKWETVKHVRSLVSCLNYLSMKNIYSYEMLNNILDMDFVKKNYGKIPQRVPREIFSLDCCIDIECPDYKGKRLPPEIRYKATKWHCEFVPSLDQYKKITAAEQLVLDTIDAVKRVVKNEQLMYVSHVLPHFPRADIILCKNKETSQFVEPTGFQKYVFGDVKVPLINENLQWYALIILGWNNTIRDSSNPLGHIVMKERQLEKIGYKPVMVIWNQFLPLSSHEKERYILEKLK